MMVRCIAIVFFSIAGLNVIAHRAAADHGKASDAGVVRAPNATIKDVSVYFHHREFSWIQIAMNDASKLQRGCWGEILGLPGSSFIIQRTTNRGLGVGVVKRDWWRTFWGSRRDHGWISCRPLKPFTLYPTITWVEPVVAGVKVGINRGEADGIVVQKCRGYVDRVPGSNFVIESLDDRNAAKSYSTVRLGTDKIRTGLRVTLTCDP